ncbi:Kef-type K+ transport system membrane component KefB [Sphingomonas jejuensis]|uniref:Kef-type K+ transport system membrane component KefB n=1 Tax=Sphingomonas jejuensis TaxID=904715 RepID=A0ABX0XMM5_9SPHN|nr:cation:proton antiporter [Sphingomonas jejuensis]NJC33991.1 Kef-type K+ transport system membrane component KefB [Sphingomonas jejuensis]
MTTAQLSILFFLQLFTIVAACRAVGWLAKRFLGQPQVVGEMIAGVVLGPSLFGLIAPDWQAALFPTETRGILYVGAQLGVGLYMFLVGLRFQSDHFRSHARSAAAVSISGMAAPFLVAIAITPWLMGVPGLFSPELTKGEATLFMGACIAITAFPMLARIIHERGLSGTPLGTLSLSAGAIDDAGAWTVLAIVLASFGDGPGVAVKAITCGVLFALFMLFAAPRLLAPLGRLVERAGTVSHGVLASVLMMFLLSAFLMDWAGIHAVFGGFLLGTAMPRGRLTEELARQLEPFTVVLLLPMFFTFSGLNTQLTLVGDPGLLSIALAILVASVLAKGGACWAAARLTGQTNATALGIGALMNARGLMELIIINIGLQRGIIGPTLFSMLVLMAILTTLMASPLFEFVYGRKARADGSMGDLGDQPVIPDTPGHAAG